MRVFVAGASGALGRRLVPKLVERGHDVVGMTRSNPDAVAAAGAEPVVADGLDRDAVVAAVRRAQPDVIVHQMTALSSLDLRRFDKTFALTNRLRTEGLDNLLAAAGDAHVVAQSYGGWPAARDRAGLATEDEPLDPDPPKQLRRTLDAIRYLERRVVSDAGGCALRYGGFYGPGTSVDRGGEHLEEIRRRRFPIVGDGGGVWSFVHVDDAAQATVLAVEQRARGVYFVVDDEPAPVRVWLPALAEVLGAPPPRRVPRWVGRLFAGEHGAVMMTEIRGASNAKAKRELGWELEHPTWRQGFRALASAGSTTPPNADIIGMRP